MKMKGNGGGDLLPSPLYLYCQLYQYPPPTYTHMGEQKCLLVCPSVCWLPEGHSICTSWRMKEWNDSNWDPGRRKCNSPALLCVIQDDSNQHNKVSVECWCRYVQVAHCFYIVNHCAAMRAKEENGQQRPSAVQLLIENRNRSNFN